MSTEGIQFDEDNLSTASRADRGGVGANSTEPAMVRWLMSHGLAKSPAMAQGILVGGIIVFVVITYFIIS